MATNWAANADRHKRFFDDLETKASILTTVTKLQKCIADHFATLEQSISQKSHALDSETKAFDFHYTTTLQNLANRENAIPEIESSEAVRVSEKKEAAISDIENAEEQAEETGEKSYSDPLRMYCRRMDSKGLMRFLFAKRKEVGLWRTELSLALEEAVDVMTLVLDAIEDFLDMKKDVRGGLAERRRSCSILIQEAIPLGENFSGAVASSVRERAVEVLERWRRVDGRNSVGNSTGMLPGEVAMFLHTVARFGVKESFGEDFLSNLVMEHSYRRDIPKVAAGLDLGDKMKDIIDELVKSGKEIEAVYFAHESGLTNEYHPVDLLNSYLENCWKRSINVSNDSESSVHAVEEAYNEEQTVKKAVLKCVEDLKLEEQHSTESLTKKIAQMEKDREGRKKSTTAAPTENPSGKRTHRGRGSGSGGGRNNTGPSPSFRPAKPANKFSNKRRRSPSFNSRIRNSTNQAVPYVYTNHRPYDGVSGGASSSSYVLGHLGAAHSQSPATLPPQYSYDHFPPNIGAQISLYGQTPYSGYDHGALNPSPYPQYQQ